MKKIPFENSRRKSNQEGLSQGKCNVQRRLKIKKNKRRKMKSFIKKTKTNPAVNKLRKLNKRPERIINQNTEIHHDKSDIINYVENTWIMRIVRLR